MNLSESYKKRLQELSGINDSSDLSIEEKGDKIYFNDSLGGYGFLVKKGSEINIVDWHSVPRDKKYSDEEQKFKRRGFAKKVIQSIKNMGYNKFNINMPSEEANLALTRLSQTGVIKPVVGSERGISVAPYYTQYEIV